jgi:hypothetical protein
MENCVLDTDACETWSLLSKSSSSNSTSAELKQCEVPLYRSKNKNTHNCEVICVYSKNEVVKQIILVHTFLALYPQNPF